MSMEVLAMSAVKEMMLLKRGLKCSKDDLKSIAAFIEMLPVRETDFVGKKAADNMKQRCAGVIRMLASN